MNPGGTSPIGRVGGLTPWQPATYTRAAGAAGAYTAGDNIGNSETGASVIPITFANAVRAPNLSGGAFGMSCVVTAASGTIVIANLAFDLLLFRPSSASIPFASGSYPADNAALNVSAAAMAQLVGIFSFSASLWRNQAGGTTAAGDHVVQVALPASGAQYCPYSLDEISFADATGQTVRPTYLLGMMQAQGAWNPGAVAQEFVFTPSYFWD